MQLISNEIKGFMSNSSWIRKMFEAGIELKKQFGAENVYDFSLGNPDLPPPPEVKKALLKIAETADMPFALGYMPNAGYMDVREKLAAKLSTEQKTNVSAKDVVLSCGAAGGINAFLRAVLSEGDEVITPAPYFVEYNFYVGNFGGKLKPVMSKDFTFDLDVNAIDQAITPQTRAIIVNSPHNPTGAIYSRSDLEKLAAVLKKHSEKNNRVIYMIADEPYRFLNYDNVDIPSVFELYTYSVVIGSFSKSLSLAGARIGYVAVNPAIENSSELVNAIIMTNRILGFVNAPAIAQKILLECLDSQVDLEIYRRRRNLMAEVLREAEIEFTMPRGAFYFFIKSPVPDEGEFIQALLDEHILAVPGCGFGCKGYARLTFCVNDSVIANSREGFKRAVAKLKK